MPPPESNLNLSNRERAILIKWIDQGAEWKDHWAFLPPERKFPSQESQQFFSNEIDQFVYDKLKEKKLDFEPIADKETLVRRLTFDLTGLPPTIKQINKFLSDTLDGSYERLVDRLMGSSAFAERLTLDWLDLSRYADSRGLHADGLRTMWPWRDWVIKLLRITCLTINSSHFNWLATFCLTQQEQKLATTFNETHL